MCGWLTDEFIKHTQVHLQLHSHFTGSYNCAYNLSEIHDAFPVNCLDLCSYL